MSPIRASTAAPTSRRTRSRPPSTVDSCHFELNGTNATGVYSYAGSTGFRLINNRFYGVSGAVPNQAVEARTPFSVCTGNEWEDSSEYIVAATRQDGDPAYVTNAGTMPTYGMLVVPDVFDSVYVRDQPKQRAISLMTQATWTCQTKIVQVLPYGTIRIGGKDVKLSPGSGYTTMTITDSAGNPYQPFITATGATVQYLGTSYNVPPWRAARRAADQHGRQLPAERTAEGDRRRIGRGGCRHRRRAGAALEAAPGEDGPGITVNFSTAGGLTLAPLRAAEAVEVAGNLVWV